MKSKWTTYILLFVACAVWGGIAWRLLSPKPGAAVEAVRRETKPAPVEKSDTLYLSYPDPFLGRELKRAAPPVVKKNVTVSNTAAGAKPVRPPVMHKVRYIGCISKEGVPYCLAEIDGRFVSLAEGESDDDYKLVKIYGDSVLFAKDKDRFTVALAQ